MSLLASATEVPTLTTIAAVVGFAGLETPVWDRLSASLGGPRELRILAMMPAEVMQKAIRDLRIVSGPPPSDGDPSPTREPNATETIQLALVWRVARQVMGLVDVDPMVTNATSTSIPGGGFPGTGASVPGVAAGVPAAAGAATPSAKKVKISSVLDQADDTEVEIKSRAELVAYFENHREITGSDPLPEVEPTDIQVVAMEEKVVVRDEAPYADFSILTPFGRRMQKTMKMKSFAFQPDGTWKTAEIPGPPNLQAWQACFKVYRGSALHAPIPGRDHHGSSSCSWPSGAGDQSTASGTTSLARAVLRGLHGTLLGVPGVLASVDASRRQNARREVRAPEKRTGKIPCCREGPSGDQLRPGEAMGRGVPSGGAGSPLLGLECEEARSSLPREIQVDPTALVGTHLRWGQRVSAERGESSRCRAKWKRTQEGKEEEKEREEEALPCRLCRLGVQGEQEGKEGAPGQKEQQRAPKEMGRALSLNARWQTNLLCFREGGTPPMHAQASARTTGLIVVSTVWETTKTRIARRIGARVGEKETRNRGVAPVRARPLQKRSSNCLPGQQTFKRSKEKKQGKEL